MKFFNPKYFEDEKTEFKEVKKITENDPEYISIKEMVHKMIEKLSREADKIRFKRNFYDYFETITREKEKEIYGAITYDEKDCMYTCSNFNTEDYVVDFTINVLRHSKPVIYWEVFDDILTVFFHADKKVVVDHFYFVVNSEHAKLRILEEYYFYS